MKGWEREIDISTDSNDFEDFDWDDTLTSTNEATFILTGKGTDNIFLRGLISAVEVIVEYDNNIIGGNGRFPS